MKCKSKHFTEGSPKLPPALGIKAEPFCVAQGPAHSPATFLRDFFSRHPLRPDSCPLIPWHLAQLVRLPNCPPLTFLPEKRPSLQQPAHTSSVRLPSLPLQSREVPFFVHHTAVTCYIPASLTRRGVPALFILAMPLRSPGPHPAKRQAHRLLRTVCQTLLLLTFPVIDGRASPDPLPHGFAFSILSETSFFYLPHGGCGERVNLSGV